MNLFLRIIRTFDDYDLLTIHVIQTLTLLSHTHTLSLCICPSVSLSMLFFSSLSVSLLWISKFIRHWIHINRIFYFTKISNNKMSNHLLIKIPLRPLYQIKHRLHFLSLSLFSFCNHCFVATRKHLYHHHHHDCIPHISVNIL